jgi:PTS system mannose-specific IID component
MAMFLRLMLVQGSWTYESMLGTGLGFALEPALRRLPGGRGGDAYRAAVARQSAYFNSHPYLAAIAAGALARAELDGAPPDMIVRFRTALSGPLGSLGDRLVWAAALPAASLVALLMYGIGAGPLVVVGTFLLLYNAVHVFLRAWGLEMGWRHGLRVSTALASPVLRAWPGYISRVGALAAGIAVPLVTKRLVGGDQLLHFVVLLVSSAAALGLVQLAGRLQGWVFAAATLLAVTIAAVLG